MSALQEYSHRYARALDAVAHPLESSAAVLSFLLGLLSGKVASVAEGARNVAAYTLGMHSAPWGSRDSPAGVLHARKATPNTLLPHPFSPHAQAGALYCHQARRRRRAAW